MKRMTTLSHSSSPPDPVTAYALRVVGGEEVAGPHVRGACRRHLDDLMNGHERGLRWDAKAAQLVLDFCPLVVRLAGGEHEGKPFEPLPWQQFILGSLFGWKRADGYRRFRRAFVETAKGSGKSPMAATVGLSMLLLDREARAEVYAAATKKDQAMILFRDAVAMVQQSPALMKRLTLSGRNPVWQITDLKSGSWFKPISSDDGQSGPRPHCALVDEVHEHKDRRTIEMLERGFKGRRQPLLFLITNSGSDRTGPAWEEHEFACRLCAGDVVDDEAFAYVCALDEGDDPLNDRSCWPKANPSLGVTIRPDYLESAVAQAKAIPGRLNTILRLNFCMWTDAATAWIGRDTWNRLQVDDRREELTGCSVFVGLDLSSRQDLTAAVFVVPLEPDAEGNARFHAWAEFWTPGDTVQQRALRDRAPYDVWTDEGHLNAPAGPKVRFDCIAARLVEVSEQFDLKAVAYDRHLVHQLEDALDEIGATLPLVEHPQGWNRRRDVPLWMPGSIDELETLILEERIEVSRNPVLTWNVAGTAFLESESGLRRFSKQRATGRIDGSVALAMAVGAASAPHEDDGMDDYFKALAGEAA